MLFATVRHSFENASGTRHNGGARHRDAGGQDRTTRVQAGGPPHLPANQEHRGRNYAVDAEDAVPDDERPELVILQFELPRLAGC